jgi:deazaflavin-dependent oxidoreductase (nitroreductase family)
MRGVLGRLVNPVMVRVGGYLPGWAVLETRGRRTGLPRRVPVGDGLRANTFWLVAEHGRLADYVRNLEAEPRVRVRVRGMWRTGLARILPEDDPSARLRWLGGLNPGVVRAAGTDLLTVRVDLDPAPRSVTRQGALAGIAAGMLGGIPSTLHAAATGRSPLGGVRAAGNLLAPAHAPRWLLLALGPVAHVAVSAGWGVILAHALPRGREVTGGVAAGLGIAALDLGIVGRRLPLIRALPQAPQVADHAAYGLVAGLIIRRYRRDA